MSAANAHPSPIKNLRPLRLRLALAVALAASSWALTATSPNADGFESVPGSTFATKSTRVLIAADFVEWTGWHSAGLSLHRYGHQYRNATTLRDELLSEGYKIARGGIQAPPGLWPVDELLKRHDGDYAMVLLGGPLIELSDLAIRSSGNALNIRVIPRATPSPGLELRICGATPDSDAIVWTGDGTVSAPCVTVTFLADDIGRGSLLCLCRYLVFDREIESVFGGAWNRPNRFAPEIVCIPLGNALPAVGDRQVEPGGGVDAEAFSSAWRKCQREVRRSLIESETCAAVRECLGNMQLSDLPVRLLEVTSKYLVFGTGRDNGFACSAHGGILEVQIVFYRPTAVIVSVYAGFRRAE